MLNGKLPHGLLELFLLPQMAVGALPKLSFALLLLKGFLVVVCVFDEVVFDVKGTIIVEVICVTILSVV